MTSATSTGRRGAGPRRSHEPRGKGFALARELLGSNVDRRNLSIYHARPEELDGQFDLVFCGSVLIHLPTSCWRCSAWPS